MNLFPYCFRGTHRSAVAPLQHPAALDPIISGGHQGYRFAVGDMLLLRMRSARVCSSSEGRMGTDFCRTIAP